MLPDRSTITRFLEKDLWCARLAELPTARAMAFRALRVAMVSYRRFSEDQCLLRASALTLFTLLSIVPMFAMAFGIAQGFGLQNAIERVVLQQLASQEEVARWIMSFAHSLLQTTRGGLIAGIGVAVLFWTVMKVLNHIEVSLNAIWRTSSQRNFARRVSDYLSFMLIAPILLIISSSLTVMISQQVGFMSQRFEIVGYFHSTILAILRLSPYVVMWALFTFLYIFMPNVRVRIASAALGGVIAGTFYQLFQAAYIYFQVGVSNYNAIYGSFAALPLFLTWLQASWMIVLLGAEISHAHQHVEWFEFEPEVRGLNRATRNLVALWVMQQVARRFSEGERRCTVEDLAGSGMIPLLLVRQTLDELEESGLVTEVAPREATREGGVGPGGVCYQPALPVSDLTIKQVLDRLEVRGNGFEWCPGSRPAAELESLSQALSGLRRCVEDSPANLRLLDLSRASPG
jgi:membrane protein